MLSSKYEDSPPSPSSSIPFLRDPDHVDRRSLLDQIHEKLSVPASRAALVGPGGVRYNLNSPEFLAQDGDNPRYHPPIMPKYGRSHEDLVPYPNRPLNNPADISAETEISAEHVSSVRPAPTTALRCENFFPCIRKRRRPFLPSQHSRGGAREYKSMG